MDKIADDFSFVYLKVWIWKYGYESKDMEVWI